MRFGHLVRNHQPITAVPTAVKEACRKARSSIGYNRGGRARLTHESAYVPGTMRLTADLSRRLYAGERASVDDATRNVACWIPWPYGGCKCSDKFGVKLGRWQTLVVHDDASSFIPFFLSVFRVEQSYRAIDAASVIYQTEKEICQFDNWSIEGGVWQAKKTLAVLGGRFISAKGRPNQKLVENYFGRLWTEISNQKGDVGRHRGEIKATSDLYVKARQGSVDPRLHFMSLSQGQDALHASINYLNEKEVRSKTYGVWVPKERWFSDLAQSPKPTRNTADDFLILPCLKKIKVRSHQLNTIEVGPLGLPMTWSFTSDWLHQYEGRDIDLYFDPLSEWPVQATVTLRDSRKPLGIVECTNAYGESKDRAIDLVKAARNAVITQSRNLTDHSSKTLIRHPEGTTKIESHSKELPETTQREIIIPHTVRDIAAIAPQASRDTLSRALELRARAAREESQI